MLGVLLAIVGFAQALPGFKPLDDAVPTYAVPYRPELPEGALVVPETEEPAEASVEFFKGEVKRLQTELARLTSPDNTPLRNLEHTIDSLMMSYSALEGYANRKLAEPPMLNIVLESKDATLCALFRGSEINTEPKPLMPKACHDVLTRRDDLLKTAESFDCPDKPVEGALYYSPKLNLFACFMVVDSVLTLGMQVKPTDLEFQVKFTFSKEFVPGFVGSEDGVRDGIQHIRSQFQKNQIPSQKEGLQQWLADWDKAAETVAASLGPATSETFISPTAVKVFVLTEAAQLGRLPIDSVYEYLPLDAQDTAHRDFLRFEKQRPETLSNAYIQLFNNPNLKLLVRAPFPEILGDGN